MKLIASILAAFFAGIGSVLICRCWRCKSEQRKLCEMAQKETATREKTK